MGDYYQYLWKATWIETSGIVLLGLFILARYIWKVYTKAQKELKLKDKLSLIFKGLGWLLVFSIYLLIFNASEPDWFAKPVQVQGEIQGKSMTSNSHNPYSIELEWESGRETLLLDHYTYQKLEAGQRVNVTFLPNRLEVVTCKVLPPSKEEKEDIANAPSQENGEKI